MINKKAGTMEGWITGIFIAMLFVIIFTIIVVPGMNSSHLGDYAVEGLPTSGLEDKFQSYQSGMNEKLSSGDVSFLGALGMTLSTSWDVISSTITTIAYFLIGGWIFTICSMMHLSGLVAGILMGLYNIAIGFVILRIIFKVRV